MKLELTPGCRRSKNITGARVQTTAKKNLPPDVQAYISGHHSTEDGVGAPRARGALSLEKLTIWEICVNGVQQVWRKKDEVEMFKN